MKSHSTGHPQLTFVREFQKLAFKFGKKSSFFSPPVSTKEELLYKLEINRPNEPAREYSVKFGANFDKSV